MKSRHLWVLLAVLLAGCRYEHQFDNIQLEGDDPAFVMPLIKSTLTFSEMAERTGANTTVHYDEATGECYLLFRDSKNIDGGGSLVDKILTGVDNLVFNNTSLILKDVVDNKLIFAQKIEVGGGQSFVNKIYPQTCRVVVTLTNNTGQAIDGKLVFESLRSNSNGAPFEHTIDNSISGAYKIWDIKAGNMYSDYNAYVDFDPLNRDSTNTIFISIQNLHRDGIPSDDPSGIEIAAEFHAIVTDSLWGRFALPTGLDFDAGSIGMDVDVFKHTMDADLHLKEPSITFNVVNEGYPFQVQFDNVRAMRTVGSDTALMLVENRPGVALNQTENPRDIAIGPTAWNFAGTGTYTYVLDWKNSTLDDAFNVAPNRVWCDMRLKAEAANENSLTQNYWVSKDKGLGLRLDTEIKLPLYGYANFVIKHDTISNIDIPDVKISEFGMDEATVRLYLNADNGMPLDLVLQLYFLDDTYAKVDSILVDPNKNFIQSAPADRVTGKATGKTRTEHVVEWNYERYQRIRNAQYMMLTVGFHTLWADRQKGSTPPDVKVMKDDLLDVWLGVEVEPHMARVKVL